jgi:transposase
VKKLIEWLKQMEIRNVCMESTGVYWIPLYNSLSEAGFTVAVVNAHQVKRVRKPKSDIADAQWLQYLYSVGMIYHSFIPAEAIMALRTIARQRDRLTEEAARQLQYMQQALDEMNLHLHHVLDDLAGKSGQAIVEAILAGERDPEKLANLCHRRVRASRQLIVESLTGQWRDEQVFVIEQAHRNRLGLLEQIQKCDERLWDLAQKLEERKPEAAPEPAPRRGRPRKGQPGQDQASQSAPERRYKAVKSRNAPSQGEAWARRLHALFGVDLTAVPGISLTVALLLLTEIGTSWDKFASCASFASWLGLCPNNQRSSNRVLRRRTAPVQNRIKVALRMAAQSLWQSNTPLGEQYRRYKGRLGPAAANTIMAHKLARIIHHMVTHQEEYDPCLALAADEKRTRIQTNNLRKQAQRLGYVITPIPKAA